MQDQGMGGMPPPGGMPPAGGGAPLPMGGMPGGSPGGGMGFGKNGVKSGLIYYGGSVLSRGKFRDYLRNRKNYYSGGMVY